MAIMPVEEHTQDVKLYRHEPKTLLPLLAQHLPWALPVYGTIKINDWPNQSDNVVQVLGSTSHPVTADEETQRSLQTLAWVTFPPSQLANPPEVWAIIIHLPAPAQHQTRLFCSAESTVHRLAAASEQNDAKRVHAVDPIRAEGQRVMNAATRLFITNSIHVRKLGALSALWTKGVADTHSVEENVTCDSYLAPADFADAGAGAGAGAAGIAGAGLYIDTACAEDCQAIADTREIKEDVEYYIACLPRTTVLRPKAAKVRESNAAVAWILTHPAGDQGALYVLPEYRRRGLAKWVTKERLSVCAAETGIEGYVWVLRGNIPSEDLWKDMGWRQGWSVQWVVVR